VSEATGLTTREAAEQFTERLGGKLVSCEVLSHRRIYMEVAPEDLPETALYLWGDRRARFNIASGLQTPGGFEVLYHFSLDEHDMVISVRVRTDEKENPVLPSVAGKIKAFNMIERELHDLLGIKFEGHPDLVPLLRAEDWPDGFYPLRRTEERAELDVGIGGKDS